MCVAFGRCAKRYYTFCTVDISTPFNANSHFKQLLYVYAVHTPHTRGLCSPCIYLIKWLYLYIRVYTQQEFFFLALFFLTGERERARPLFSTADMVGFYGRQKSFTFKFRISVHNIHMGIGYTNKQTKKKKIEFHTRLRGLLKCNTTMRCVDSVHTHTHTAIRTLLVGTSKIAMVATQQLASPHQYIKYMPESVLFETLSAATSHQTPRRITYISI